MPSLESTSIPTRRNDLILRADRYSPRRWTIIDAVSGRIMRINATDLRAIGSASCHSNATIDPTLSAQAIASGMLRRRAQSSAKRSFSVMSLLAFRVPLFNIDAFAKWFAPRTGLLYSPAALLTWGTLILAAMLSLLIDWARAEQSLLSVYYASASPTTLGYTLGVSFLITKCLHELGHAIACRRLGAQVGDCGLFFFLGIPCPYVDVSRVWQFDSKLARASVMLAGIYTELVVAAIATATWWLTPPGPAHLFAMNLILVSGISTVLFNANPLMRMDGYFVLSDLLGSSNLRRQASLAWHALAITRLSGTAPVARVSYSSVLLSLYHIASTIYRLMIVILIAAFCFALLREWQLWWIGVVMFLATTAIIAYRVLTQWTRMLCGNGIWQNIPIWRRIGFTSLGLVALSIGIFFPVPREIASKGFVDVADASEVYAFESGWVSEVNREFGESVHAGEALASLRNDELAVQLVGLKSRQRISEIESNYLKRKSLQSPETDVAWQVDKANRELVESQLQSLLSREQRLVLQSPKSGIVLPPLPSSISAGRFGSIEQRPIARLEDRKETYVQSRSVWCRIGTPEQLSVILPITAEDRQYLHPGHEVKLVMDNGTVRHWNGVIQSIEELATHDNDDHVVNFVARCELSSDSELAANVSIIGMLVSVRIRFDQEPAWQWAKRTINEWLRSNH